MALTVAVLMGGKSAEREVSIETGTAICVALTELGHRVVEIDVDRNLPERLLAGRPDVAFLALHGRGGEDGTIQGLLEVMRIPYTGSGVLASAVTMDKVVTKEILRYHGIPTAPDLVVNRGEHYEEVAVDVERELSFPVMVKPACEGSSIGVTEVRAASELSSALDRVFASDCRALVERFISGRLLTVGILGRKPLVLPVLEIKPHQGFYDYRAKYEPGMTDYEVPADIAPEVASLAQDISLRAFDILGCEDVSRVDLILEDESQELIFLEINTIPGMTQTSLLPKAASARGMEFGEVVSMILDGARLKTDMPG